MRFCLISNAINITVLTQTSDHRSPAQTSLNTFLLCVQGEGHHCLLADYFIRSQCLLRSTYCVLGPMSSHGESHDHLSPRSSATSWWGSGLGSVSVAERHVGSGKHLSKGSSRAVGTPAAQQWRLLGLVGSARTACRRLVVRLDPEQAALRCRWRVPQGLTGIQDLHGP